jgi:hypothetical protein
MILITAKEFLSFSFSYCYLSRQNMIHNASSRGDVAAADDDEEKSRSSSPNPQNR